MFLVVQLYAGGDQKEVVEDMKEQWRIFYG